MSCTIFPNQNRRPGNHPSQRQYQQRQQKRKAVQKCESSTGQRRNLDAKSLKNRLCLRS
ncbi:MAG: hypothetical protein ACK5AN_23530 [Planctomyces sp.]